MAEKKAIVTHLTALQEIASMKVLCSDKTGTLTTANMTIISDKIWTAEGFTQVMMRYAHIWIYPRSPTLTWIRAQNTPRCFLHAYSKTYFHPSTRFYFSGTCARPFVSLSVSTEGPSLDLGGAGVEPQQQGGPHRPIGVPGLRTALRRGTGGGSGGGVQGACWWACERLLERMHSRSYTYEEEVILFFSRFHLSSI